MRNEADPGLEHKAEEEPQGGFQLIKSTLITNSWLEKCHDPHLITAYACALSGRDTRLP